MVSGKMTKAKWGSYELEAYYSGNRASPFDPTNMHINLIKITNSTNGQFGHFEVWGTKDEPKIRTKKQLILKFHGLLQSALLGALDPLNFCKVMNLPPDNQLLSEPRFCACRSTTKAMFTILTENINEILQKMKRQGLGNEK